MALDNGDHIQYLLQIDVAPTVKALEDFATVGNKSINEIEKNVVDLEKKISSLGNAIGRIKSKKGQESAFLFGSDGKKELKTLSQLEGQYKSLKDEAVAYTKALTQIRNDQAQVEDTVRRVTSANKEFQNGLDKQPQKIKQVQSAYDQLFKQIEKLEKLPVRTDEQNRLLDRLHKSRQLESNDLQELINLEAKYGKQIKASQDAKARELALQVEAARREQAQARINARLGVKPQTGEISRLNRQGALNAAFAAIPTEEKLSSAQIQRIQADRQQRIQDYLNKLNNVKDPLGAISYQNRQRSLNATFSALPSNADLEAQQRQSIATAQRNAETRQRVLANIEASKLGRESSNFGKGDQQAKESTRQLKELTATYKAARREVTELIKTASSKEDYQAIRLKTEAMFAYESQVKKAIGSVSRLNAESKDVISARTAIQTPIFSAVKQQQAKPTRAVLPPDIAAQGKIIEADLKRLTGEYLRAAKAAESLKQASKGFATPELKQATEVAERLKLELQKTVKVANELGHSTVSVSRGNEALSRTFGSTTNSVFKLFQGVSQLGFAFFGLQAAVYAVTIPLGAIKTAFIDTNAELEATQISFAGTFNNIFVEDFSKSLERSTDLVRKIRNEAARTNLTFQELQEVMGTTLPQVLAKGGNADTALQIGSLVAQQAKVSLGKNFASSRVNDEVRALLSGKITNKNETLINLGITKEDVKNAKDIDGILKLVQERTQGLAAANAAYQTTFSGAKDRASEFLLVINQFIGKPLFDAATDSLNALNREFATFIDKSGNVDESKIGGFLLTVKGINVALAITIQRLGDLFNSLKPLTAFFTNTPIGRIIAAGLTGGAAGFGIGAGFGASAGPAGALAAGGTGAGVGAGIGVGVQTLAEIGLANDGNFQRSRFDRSGQLTLVKGGKKVGQVDGTRDLLLNKFKDNELASLQKTTQERVNRLQFTKDAINSGRSRLNPAEIAAFNKKYERETGVLKRVQDAAKIRSGSAANTPGIRRNAAPSEEAGKTKQPSTLGLKGLNDLGEVQKVINKYDEMIQNLDSGAKINQALIESINPGSLTTIDLEIDTLTKKFQLLNEKRSAVFNATEGAKASRDKVQAQFEAVQKADQANPGDAARVQLLSVLSDKYNEFRADYEKGEKERLSLNKQINDSEADIIQKTRARFDAELQRNTQLIEATNRYTQAIADNGSAAESAQQRQVNEQNIVRANIEQTVKEIKKLEELKTSISVNGIANPEDENELRAVTERLGLLNNQLVVYNENLKDIETSGGLNVIQAQLGEQNLNIETARLSFGANTQRNADQSRINANLEAIRGYDAIISNPNSTKEQIRASQEAKNKIVKDTLDIRKAYEVNIVDAGKNAFDSFFDNILNGTASFKDSFVGFIKDIATQIQRQFSSAIADGITSAFGGKNGPALNLSGVGSSIGQKLLGFFTKRPASTATAAAGSGGGLGTAAAGGLSKFAGALGPIAAVAIPIASAVNALSGKKPAAQRIASFIDPLNFRKFVGLGDPSKKNQAAVQAAAEKGQERLANFASNLNIQNLKDLEASQKQLEVEYRNARKNVDKQKGKGAKQAKQSSQQSLKQSYTQIKAQLAQIREQLQEELTKIKAELKLSIEELQQPEGNRGIRKDLIQSATDLKELIKKGVDKNVINEYFELQVKDIIAQTQEQLDKVNEQINRGVSNERGELVSLQQGLEDELRKIQEDATKQRESLRQSFAGEAQGILSEGRASAISLSPQSRQERLAQAIALQRKDETKLNTETTNSILKQTNETNREIRQLQEDQVTLLARIAYIINAGFEAGNLLGTGFQGTQLSQIKDFLNTFNPVGASNLAPALQAGAMAINIDKLVLDPTLSDAALGALMKRTLEEYSARTNLTRTIQFG